MSRNAWLALFFATAVAGPAIAQKPPGPGTPAPAGTPSLTVQNATPNIINNVYVSPSSVQSWGQDQLGASEVVNAGASRAFALAPGECTYDIRIVYQGGLAEERRRIDACAGPTLVLPMAAQRLPRG